MSNKRKKFQSNYENLKSCLSELGFPEPHEVVDVDSDKFITGIQDDDFEMPIEITCKADIVSFKVTSTLLFNVPEMPFYQLLNEINLRLMDIGHFAINEADGDVVFQTSVDLLANDFDREQMLATIQRISLQGLEVYKLLKEIFESDQCPFYFLHNYIEEMRERQVDDEKNIH
jgi:hypothetical protein